ncbi:DCN1-like protein 3 [Esox lucius]|uniref:DCN1-like protein n=1 Tax=Esox lucius TaxID=8010 RepID=A0A3P8Y0W8_ESOLU|nr:DCN1-like protein 3 [Esox lucius]XP_010892832.1 DCN1-like protein 3 [Esox lucius]XP_019902376.1 DCN1-like protein 3 [Esox lucius]
MGQCVTKCKNPSSSLGSKSGDKEPGSKSQPRKGVGTGGRGIGHKEEHSAPSSKASSEPIFNGTKASDMDVTVETAMTPVSTMMGEQRKEERPADGEGPSLLRIEELFRHYKDPQEDAILEEGMERFCNDLCVDPAEFRVLVLAWKFQAATMCKFTRKEFVDGCRAIQADSLEGIFSRFPCMLLEAQGEESFKDLYRFTFQFGLDADEGQRSLQRDIAIALWRLVFTQDTPAILERWLDFLDDNPSGVRGISRDTWNMFLNFTQAIGPDLSNYSEDEAWPSLFDTFVEWEMEHRKKEEQEELLKRAVEEEERGRTKTDESLPSSTDRLETEGGRGSQTLGDH